MSKSYRKPWGTCCSIRNSAHDDKTVAARSMRRAQEQSLREAFRDENWDSWLIPERYECRHNDVWGWGRDGKQHSLDTRWTTKEYNNPYAYVSSPTWMDEEQIFARWEERKQRTDDFIRDACRK